MRYEFLSGSQWVLCLRQDQSMVLCDSCALCSTAFLEAKKKDPCEVLLKSLVLEHLTLEINNERIGSRGHGKKHD